MDVLTTPFAGRCTVPIDVHHRFLLLKVSTNITHCTIRLDG